SVAHGQRGGGFDLVDLDGMPVDEGSAVDGLGHGAQASGRLSKSGMSTRCRLPYPRASLVNRIWSANGFTVGCTCTAWVWKEPRCRWTSRGPANASPVRRQTISCGFVFVPSPTIVSRSRLWYCIELSASGASHRLLPYKCTAPWKESLWSSSDQPLWPMCSL